MSSQPFDPLASSAPLIVYIDYKSPYAYLAVEPAYKMAEELGLEIDWRPFTLDIASYLGTARLNQEGKVVEENRAPGQWLRVKYAYRDVRRYGSMRGIVVRGTVKIWDTSLAGIAMLWAKAQGPAILRAYSALVYERFWKRELDVEDIGVIEGILKEAGARIEGFRAYASGEGRALHDRIQHAAFDAGIFGVPTFVINRERFFGREHLPRLRWMLTGRHGAPPDIAYRDVATRRAKDRSRLPVAIDFKSPQAYLAIAPTCALADELGVAIDWLPVILSPGAIPPTGDDRASRHRRTRAEYLERDVARYAADRGVDIRGFQRHSDSTLASLGLLWAKRHGAQVARTYVERVFERYGNQTFDIEDERAIAALLAEVGAPAGFEAFAKGEGRAELARIQSELREAGVFEVPTYIIDGEPFIGRQHLPLMRSMLSP
jgi:2-hydroxychromene-2-carboxylate isomerase